MTRKYVVKKGDTLTKIAVSERVDRNELAALNGIHNQNLIKVDQVLRLPPRFIDVYPVEIATIPVPVVESLKVVACQFIDAANNPIEGMDVAVTVGLVEMTHITDSHGFIPLISLEPEDVVKVAVKKTTGEWKRVSEVKPAAPATHARIVSSKVRKSAETQLHDGPPQTTTKIKARPQEIGSVVMERSKNGNPVQSVALECPNQENLRLGENFKYRDIILEASRRSKLSPQSIAAIMNAEAATIVVETQIPIFDRKSGKQKIGNDGKPQFKIVKAATGEWDPHSSNRRSSARGMTQFLDSTWISLALTEGTYLHDRIKQEGLLTTTIKSIKHGKKIVDTPCLAFKLSNGTLVTSNSKKGLDRILSSRSYIPRYAESTDANIQKLLDLRYDARCSIHAAVDYGVQNLKRLEVEGLKIDGIGDGEKAKLVYLTHHLGAADAISFIRNTMNEDKAKYLLIQQVGAGSASSRSKQEGNDYLKAHRKWLSGFIDRRVDIFQSMCNKNGLAVKNLMDITLAIR